MQTEQRRRIRELFEQAIDLPEADRAAFVDRSCAGEPAVRAELEGLLKALADNGEFQSAGQAGPLPAGGPGPAATTDAEAKPSALQPHRPFASPTAHDALDALDALSGAKLVSRRIGPYRLLELIGEGGFGDVYLAEQERPVRRRVALKILKPGMDSRGVVARFEQERQALALMDHPNIARVLDAGATADGRPYVVMELVRGEPLGAFCDRHRLGIRARIELFKTVCEAVQHAHQKGIIHRDLKPSNVLVALSDVGGGKPVAKVIDFGIAKATGEPLTDKTLFTEHRQLIGTPEYMSPEQAEMRAIDIDTRSDIYSLGVLLYELLTGTTPLDAKTLRSAALGEMQRLIREVDPPRPSTRVRTMARTAGDAPVSKPAPSAAPGAKPAAQGQALTAEGIAAARDTDIAGLRRQLANELDWIVMKALEKDRTRRYDTASALSADLQRFLDGRAVEAGPPSTFYRVQVVARRNRVAFSAGAAIGLALVVGFTLATIGLVRAAEERDLAKAAQVRESDARTAAERERQEAQRARDEAQASGASAERRRVEAERLLARAALSAAGAALQSGNAPVASASLRSVPPERRSWEWRVLNLLVERGGVTIKLAPQDRIWGIWPLTDPSRVAINLRGDPGANLIANVDTGEVLQRFTGGVGPVSPDDRRVAQIKDGDLIVFDIASARELWRAPRSAPERPWSMGLGAFSLDGAELVATDRSGALTFFAAPSGAVIRTVTPSTPAYSGASFVDLGAGPSSRDVVFFPAAGRLQLYSVESGECRLAALGYDLLPGRTHSSTGNSFTPVIGDAEIALEAAPNSPPVSSCDIAPDGRAGVFSDVFGMLSLARIPEGARALRPLRRFPGAPSRIDQVVYSRDGQRLIIAFGQSEVRTLPVDAHALDYFLPLQTASTVAFSPDRSRGVRAFWGEASAFDTALGLPLWSRTLCSLIFGSAAWSPDGRVVALATYPRSPGGPSELYILDAHTGASIVSIGASAQVPDPVWGRAQPPWLKSVRALAFSADGSRLILSFVDGSIRALETARWTLLDSPRADPVVAPADDITPREPTTALVALSRSDGTELLAQIVPSSPAPQDADAPRAGAPRAAIVLRDARSFELLHAFSLPDIEPLCLAASPDGIQLIVGDARGVVLCLDTRSRTLCWRTEATAPFCSALAVSPDSARVVAAFSSAQLGSFEMASGQLIAGLPVFPGDTRSMAFTRDGESLLIGGAQRPLGRIDAALPGPELGPALARWPSSAPTPRTALQARSWVLQAYELLQETIPAAWDRAQALAMIRSANHLPLGVRELAAHILQQQGFPIRFGNNRALLVMQDPNATAAQLENVAILLRDLTLSEPNDPPVHLNLGEVLFRLGRPEQCIPPLERGQELLTRRQIDPSPLARLTLSIAYAQTGQRDRALSEYRAARAGLTDRALAEDPALAARAHKADALFAGDAENSK